MPISNGKFRCPYCYEIHRLEDCIVKCTSNRPGVPMDSVDSCPVGVVKSAEGYIPQQKKKSCMKCKRVAKMLYCPNGIDANGNGFLNEIPSLFLEQDALPIALVGAKASGKSVYVTVLVDEILHRMTSPFSCSLDRNVVSASWQRYLSDYYTPLYKERRMPNATTAGVTPPPMIFPIHFNGGRGGDKVATLTFYDTSGENFDDPMQLATYTKYLPNAKGIILLLDPLQLDSVRERLAKKNVPLPEQNTETDLILNNVMRLIRDMNNIKGSGKIDIPIALVFTKVDVLLEHFEEIAPESALRRNSEHLRNGRFVQSDFEEIDITMRDILGAVTEQSHILEACKNFRRVGVFGVSSLGENPSGFFRISDKPHPHRVLDPLLWILAENRYVPTVKTQR